MYQILRAAELYICNELNKLDSSQKIGSHIESHCQTSSYKSNSFYDFKDCINDLCEFMNIIGKKFYACTEMFSRSLSELYSVANVDSTESTEIKSNFILELLNQLCPKKKFRNKDKIKALVYLNKCIKKICKYSSIVG